MSVQSFIPEVWSAELLQALDKTLVFGSSNVANRDYEGDISGFGDTVHINSVSDPTIGTYTANSTTITPEELTTAQRNLVIDQAKYFAFYVDDVDARQVRNDGALMSEAMRRAGYKLRDTADQFIAGLYTGVASANAITTTTVTSGNAYEKLIDLKVKLDEANCPNEMRYAVVPPWYHGLLLKDNRFIDASASADGGNALHNGRVGRAGGFDIFVSNNAINVTGDDYIVQAGVPDAITYAEQIVKVEAYRPEDGFEDAIKGLHVYGAKLTRPDCIATLVASQS